MTKIIFTKRGITEFEVYDRQAMIDRYGLTPQQFIDLKGLMGDASDNIPGIPGVGEKTATKLLLEYGSVENIIASVGSMKKSKLKEKIEENAQMAVMSKRLATINTNVPLNIDFEELRYEEPDSQRLIELYKRLEFNSLPPEDGEVFRRRFHKDRKFFGGGRCFRRTGFAKTVRRFSRGFGGNPGSGAVRFFIRRISFCGYRQSRYQGEARRDERRPVTDGIPLAEDFSRQCARHPS